MLGVRLCDSAIKELGPIATQVIYWCDSQPCFNGFTQNRANITRSSHTGSPKFLTAVPLHSGGLSQANWIEQATDPAEFPLLFYNSTQMVPLPRLSRLTSIFFFGLIVEPSSDDPEVSPAKWVGYIQVTNEPIIQNSSNLHKLKRIDAWLLRFFINRHTNPQNLQFSSYVKALELLKAVRFIIRVNQRHFLADECQCFAKRRPVPSASSLANLTPFLDLFGIIRVGGRLEHSYLPETLNIQLTKLLTHATIEHTLHALPTKYPFFHPRDSINRVIRKFWTCKLRNSQLVPPLMGPLPASRLKSHLPAFTNVGIDFFGPLSVVILRRSVKRYGVMFSCLDCRAVHFEVKESLDMNSCINAFSRFADRRGLPQLATATTEQIWWPLSKKSTTPFPAETKLSWCRRMKNWKTNQSNWDSVHP